MSARRASLAVVALALFAGCAHGGERGAWRWGQSSALRESAGSASSALAAHTATAGHARSADERVDVEALLLALWARRNDASFVSELSRQLTHLLREPTLDPDVEFFLPQIGQLIVCLPSTSVHAATLERFALLTCERNVHFALQLSWVVYALLEDNAPGQPRADAGVHARCARLLSHIEQSVIYGARLRYSNRREAMRTQLARAARAISSAAASAHAPAGLRPTDFPPESAGLSRALLREPHAHGGAEHSAPATVVAAASGEAAEAAEAEAGGAGSRAPAAGAARTRAAAAASGHAASALPAGSAATRALSSSSLEARRLARSGAAGDAPLGAPAEQGGEGVDGPARGARGSTRRRGARAERRLLSAPPSAQAEVPAGAPCGFVPERCGVLWLIVGKPSAFYLSSLLGLSSHGYWRRGVWLVESVLYYGSAAEVEAAAAEPSRQPLRARGAVPLAHSRIELRTSSRGYTYVYVGARYSKAEVRLRPTASGADGARQLTSWLAALRNASVRSAVAAAAEPKRSRRPAALRRWLARACPLRALGRALGRARARLRRGARRVGPPSGAPAAARPAPPLAPRQRALSAEQRRSYQFLLAQRDLVHSLVSLAEELYGAAEPVGLARRRLGALPLAPTAYIPLCRSVDTFERLVRIPAEEAVVFVTQARASIMLYCEVLRSRSGRTVAQLFAPSGAAGPTPPLAGGVERLGARGGVHAQPAPPKIPLVRAGHALMRGALSGATRVAAATAATAAAGARVAAARAAPAVDDDADPERAVAGGARRSVERLQRRLDERWAAKAQRLRALSPLGDSSRWRLRSMLIKANDDLRQEALVMQLLCVLDRAYPRPLCLRTYHVLATGSTCGMIETLPDTKSLAHLKRGCAPGRDSLAAIFESLWGHDPPALHAARRAFLHSLAAYSVACHVLAIKDRHNGNLLLAADGALVHIDFGFALGAAPGGKCALEAKVPFKLTAEMVEVLGGPGSRLFTVELPELCTLAMRAARAHADTLVMLVETLTLQPHLKCLAGGGDAAVRGLRERLMLDVPDDELPARMKELITTSYNALGTAAYDRYQHLRNGIRY